jgi:hypothetical protein
MRARWKLTLEGSRDEALLAVDLYNQPSRTRRLEGFFIHMHLAWLYLFQARYQRDGLSYFYRKASGRYEKVNGDRKTWDLSQFVRTGWLAANEPVRKNLELTIALRNKIEHRFEDSTALATAGYAQALLVNYDAELRDTFGPGYSLGESLRFPVFVGALTREGATRMAAAQQRLPKKISNFLTEFQAPLDSSLVNDPRYEFRLNLLPKTSPKTDADLALSFVRADDLTEEQKEMLANLDKAGMVIIRDQIREVANADKLKPTAAADAIEAALPFRFSVYSHFPRAWQALKARPKAGDVHPERTLSNLCVYDKPHNDYLYTAAFVDAVVAKVCTEDGFREFLGLEPDLCSA